MYLLLLVGLGALRVNYFALIALGIAFLPASVWYGFLRAVFPKTHSETCPHFPDPAPDFPTFQVMTGSNRPPDSPAGKSPDKLTAPPAR